jgi:hypothetical protein
VNDDHTSAESAPGNRAVFVVGAGRSGTSAITRGLVALGVELGDNLKAPTAKNPTGFFEDVDLLRVAKDVRAELGLRAESVSLVEERDWAEADLEGLTADAVQTIERRFGSVPLWGFKYSQTLRFLPFWIDVLERARVDVSWVVALRNPLSVAQSRSKLDTLRGIQEKSDTEWLVNVVPYFTRLAQDPFVVVDFDCLMESPQAQLERIAAKLALPVDDRTRQRMLEFSESFLVGGMRHTVFDDGDLEKAERLNPLTRDAYRWLRRLAVDEITPDDAGLRSEWQRIEQALDQQAPSFRYLDHLVEELRRAEDRGIPGLRRRLQKRWDKASFRFR